MNGVFQRADRTFAVRISLCDRQFIHGRYSDESIAGAAYDNAAYYLHRFRRRLGRLNNKEIYADRQSRPVISENTRMLLNLAEAYEKQNPGWRNNSPRKQTAELSQQSLEVSGAPLLKPLIPAPDIRAVIAEMLNPILLRLGELEEAVTERLPARIGALENPDYSP